MALLDDIGLGWAAQMRADELSHGLHKGVELCRPCWPDPSTAARRAGHANLPHAEVEGLIETIIGVRDRYDVTVIVVEHHMGLIAALTDAVVVLDHGSKVMEGTAAQAQSDPRVIEAYIGKEKTMSLLELEKTSEPPTARSKCSKGSPCRCPTGEPSASSAPTALNKTTTLRAISGTVNTKGSIMFDGKDIRGKRPEQVAALGIAHVPEGRSTLGDLTVMENLMVGAYLRKDRKGISEDVDLLDLFPNLKDRIASNGSALSGGEQQMLAVARAVMSKPRLLMLDEASLGLAPSTAKSVYSAISTGCGNSPASRCSSSSRTPTWPSASSTPPRSWRPDAVSCPVRPRRRGMDEIRRAYLGD